MRVIFDTRIVRLYLLVLTLVSVSLIVLTGCESSAGGNAGDDVPPVLSWHIETVDETGGVGSYSSMALDSSSRPHISYFDSTNYDLKYARWTGSSWDGLDAIPGPDTVDADGNVGSYTSIAIDSNDNPCISYYDATDYDLKFVRWTGSGWAGLENPAGPDSIDLAFRKVGQYSCMALDSNDYPHISYYDSTYDDMSYSGNLKYVHWTGSEWDGLEGMDGPDLLGDVGLYTSIAVDSNDYPHVSYYNPGYYDLKYLHWTGSAWAGLEDPAGTDAIDTLGNRGKFTSIALDSNDNPHISYFADDLPTQDLRYARWTGTEWAGLANTTSVDSVDTGGAVGYYTSIAVDASDRPHISYRNETNHDLKYVRWTGSVWDGLDDTPGPDAVDTVGDVGTFTSIALDTDGYPHISYYNVTNHDLKYAYFGE